MFHQGFDKLQSFHLSFLTIEKYEDIENNFTITFFNLALVYFVQVTLSCLWNVFDLFPQH